MEKILLRAAGLLVLLILAGCALNSSSVSAPPEYLQSEIRKYSPVAGELTAYPLNGPFGGNITCLVRLGQSNTVIAGTDNGEFFRSEDVGASWTRASAESHETVNDIVTVDSLLLAATDGGIFRSVDGGKAWTQAEVVANPQAKVTKLLLFKDQLLAATYKGLFVSDRSGQSWLQLDTTFGPPTSEGMVVDLALDRNSVLVGDESHLFYTKDLRSWAPSDLGLPLESSSDSPFVKLIKAGDVPFVYLIGGGGGIYEKITEGANWTAVPGVENASSMHASGNSLFVITDETIQSRKNGGWVELGVPQRWLSVNDVVQVGNAVLAATPEGIYVRHVDTEAWTISSGGMRSSRGAGPLLLADADRFAVFDGRLFRSNGDSDWRQICEEFSGEGREPGERPPWVNDVNSLVGSLFVTTNEGLFRCNLDGGPLTRIPPPKNAKLAAKFGQFGSLVKIDNQLVVSTEGRIFRTSDGGTWEEISEGLQELSAQYMQVEFGVAEDALFLWIGEPPTGFGSGRAKTQSVFRLPKGKNKWEEVSTGVQAPVTAFAAVGDTVYATASQPDSKAGDTFRPQLLRLEHAGASQTWDLLKAVGLRGAVLSLWIDPKYPDVMLAGTTRGLFWSNDGGQKFNRSASQPGRISFSQVGAIAYHQGHLFISTDTGVFYVADRIPRGAWYAPWLKLVKDNSWLFSGTTLVILLLIVLSTKLISVLLKLDLWGINQIAPAFYLLPFGRWKLYRGYRARLGQGAGLTNDIKYGVDHYVDLPFEIDGELNSGQLSEVFTQQPLTKRVILDADGGRGKSTLCHYLAGRCVNQKDLFGCKRLTPVVVDGLTYTGDLLNAISKALQADQAYVNKTIVASQLAAGNLLVIFDGFSEIKESYLTAASSADLPEFIQQHPDTPFIFTSRSKLPPAVQQALKDSVTIKLRDVDETTERTFLSQYLKHGEQEVDALMSEIKIQFNDLPRIPLMLKLIATVYDRKAEVPQDRATLFADYADHVLRPKATGIEYPKGLLFAIRHLVRETYLRSGGDRGLTEDRGIDLLKEIKDQLVARDIELSPIRLLQLLSRAGLYRQVGENLKFFHDSFESYFGARALVSDFRGGHYELIKECAGNERLAETWRFLSEMLESTEDRQKLDSLHRERADELSKAAYLKSQRDPEVDYYLQLSSKANGYAGEINTAEGPQSLHIKLSPDGLENLSRELRFEMDRLAFAIISSRDKANYTFEEFLPQMAKLGNYAFKQIFANTGALETISKLQPTKRGGSIQIGADSFFFPWEWIYPAELHEALSYEHFWGMNHVISHLIIQEPQHDTVTAATTPGDRTRVGLLVSEDDRAAQKETSFFRTLADSERIDLEIFVPNYSLNKQARLEQLKAFFATSFDVIHFFCNVSYNKATPNDSTIQLGSEWEMKLSDIEFYDFAITSKPLVVMNTCESGNLDSLRISGFAPSFLKRGAGGVVATESKIPATTVGAFTELLYERLLAGDTLGRSLLAVRRTLWETTQNPVGLLYSMYAPPHLKLVQKQNPR
jgi:photosystem II stability/assembly factor-like uncharacterized protein